MPTKRSRKKRGKLADIPVTVWYFLNDAVDEIPEEQTNFFDLIGLQASTYPHKELAEIWTNYRDDVLKRWVLMKPGTRPHCWWLLDAPALPEDQHGRYKDWFCAKGLKIPRKRLSGIGTPAHEVLSLMPSYRYGIPTTWIQPFDVERYCSDFKGVAIDPENPPIFEAQASYLDRFGLLSDAEKEKSDFNPESVLDV